MPVDLNSALNSGDFYWTWNCVEVEHYGRAYVTGAIDISNGGQTIVPAGSLSNPPSAPVSIELWPYSISGIPGMGANDLYHGYPSTVHPDGSWSLDDPIDFPTWVSPDTDRNMYVSVSLVLVGSWDLIPEDDTPDGWTPVPPSAGFFTGSPEGVTHEEMVHLQGDLIAASDSPETISYLVPNEVQAWSPDGSGTMTLAHAPWGPCGLYQEGTRWKDMGIFTPSFIGNSRKQDLSTGFHDQARVAGGTLYYAGTYKNVDTEVIQSSTDTITCTYPATWPLIGTYDLDFPSGLIEIPSQSIDLGAAMATMSEPPDWVAIMFSAQWWIRYESYDACPADGVSEYPTDGYGHEIRFWPSVGGVANPKFITTNDSGSGDTETDEIRIDSVQGERSIHSAEENWTTSAWLAPSASDYSRPGVVEPSGMEHMQLLWKPEDVSSAAVDILGSFRTARVDLRFRLVPLYDAGDQYLKMGDVVTLDHGYAAAYPKEASGPLIMFV